jgi:hypothetical protein
MSGPAFSGDVIEYQLRLDNGARRIQLRRQSDGRYVESGEGNTIESPACLAVPDGKAAIELAALESKWKLFGYRPVGVHRRWVCLIYTAKVTGDASVFWSAVLDSGYKFELRDFDREAQVWTDAGVDANEHDIERIQRLLPEGMAPEHVLPRYLPVG